MVVTEAAKLFFSALILWMIAKFAFRAELRYMQFVEVTGLAMMIEALGLVISMGLACAYGSLLATPGPILLVGQIEVGNRIHSSLSALNVITLWQMGVMSVGMARLCGTTWIKSALWLFGIWAAMTFGLIWAFGGK